MCYIDLQSMPLGSPYHPPTKAKLRSSISDLRRRSQPVAEATGELKAATPTRHKSPPKKLGIALLKDLTFHPVILSVTV